MKVDVRPGLYMPDGPQHVAALKREEEHFRGLFWEEMSPVEWAFWVQVAMELRELWISDPVGDTQGWTVRP